MFKITNKQMLARDVKRMDILAPEIARWAQPAQFVIVTAREREEGIPLAINEADAGKGTITLIFKERGEKTRRLGTLGIGEELFAVTGPLGTPTRLGREGIVACISTGIGAAQILPICRAAKKAGNKVIGIMGAGTKTSILLEPQMRLACHKLFIATEDGSYMRRGQATALLEDVVKQEKVDCVYAVGSLEMMKAVSAWTRTRGLKTLIQIDTPVLCGIGVCASCRVKVGGSVVLACQHGPEFNAHKVDFDHLQGRLDAVKDKVTRTDAPASPGLEDLGRKVRDLFR